MLGSKSGSGVNARKERRLSEMTQMFCAVCGADVCANTLDNLASSHVALLRMRTNSSACGSVAGRIASGGASSTDVGKCRDDA